MLDNSKHNSIVNFNNFDNSQINESNQNILPFSVYCDNRNDCVEFEDFLHNHGYAYQDGNKYYISMGTYHIVTFFRIDFQFKSFTAASIKKDDQNYELLEYSKYKLGIKDFIINPDISRIDEIKKPKPTYKPKGKVERTIESIDPKNPKFQKGDKVKFIRNIVEKFTYDHKYKNFFDNYINFITKYKNSELTIDSVSWDNGYNLYMYCFNIDGIHWFEEYYFSKLPTYNPRGKVERTLENTNYNKLNENWDMFSNDDKLNKYVYTNDIKKPKYKIGQSVSLKKDALNIHIKAIDDYYNLDYSTRDWINRNAGSDTEFKINQVGYTPDKNIWILNLEYLNDIDMWISEDSVYLKSPTYKPKGKVERTLESKTDYPYRFKTIKEFEKEYGTDWMGVIKSNNYPNWADHGEMDHLFGKPFPFTKDQLDFGNEKYPLGNDMRWHDPESEYEWKISWRMLTPNKRIEPTYKPKGKIERTFESTINNQIPTYPKVAPVLTPEQQRKIFKVGDYVWVRPDAFEYFDDHNDSMSYHIGERLKILEIKTLLDAYGNIDTINDYYGKDYNTDDIILELDDETGGFTWDWYYKCLIPEKIEPTYKPKGKVERTIENIINKSNIPPITVYCDNRDDCLEFENFLHELGYVYSDGNQYHIRTGTYNTITFDKFDINRRVFQAWVFKNDVRDREMLDYSKYKKGIKIFFTNPYSFDISYIKNPIPTYKPKEKIDRKLESINENFFYEQSDVDEYCSSNSNVKKTNIKIGESYTLKNDYLDIIKSISDNNISYVEDDAIDYLKDNFYKPIKIYQKYLGNIQWWSMIGRYNGEELWVYDDVFQTEKPSPSYKPKGKVERTFESYKRKYSYDVVIVVINNTDEMKSFIEIQPPISLMIDDYYIDVLNNYNEPIYFMYNIKDGSITFNGWCNLSYLNQDLTYQNVTYEKLFTVKDVKNGLFDSILNKGYYTTHPSYKPKGKIIRRIDESLSIPNKPIELTGEQQIELFKIGDEVIIRPDGKEYTYHFVEHMNNQLGKTGTVLDYCTSISSFDFDEVYRIGYKPNDLLIHIKCENNPYYHFWWHYKSLYNPKQKTEPTYKPKGKVERTFESKKIESPYSAIIFKINNKEESRIAQENMFKFGFKWISKGQEIRTFAQHMYPIYLFLELNMQDNIINYMTLNKNETIEKYIKDASEGENICRTVFKYDDTYYIDNIIKTGMSVPSYIPKGKVERTFESQKDYPYRFKTREEFRKQYGRNWRDCDGRCRMASFVDPMDYLLGQDFKYDDVVKDFDDLTRIGIYDNQWAIYGFMITPKIKLPSYKPKERIERTLESFINEISGDDLKRKLIFSKYSCIAVRINSYNDRKKFFEIIRKYDISKIYDIRSYPIRKDYIVQLKHKDMSLDNLPIFFSNDFDYVDDGQLLIDFPNAYPTVISVEQLDDIFKNIIGINDTKRLYEPKEKTKRTLE